MAESVVGQKILDLIEPYFGVAMANSTLKLAIKDIGIEREAIQASHLPTLALDIEKRMKIFLGTEKSKAIAEMIKAIKP
jgi:hypothetical protein